MSNEDIFTGALFVLAATSTALVLMSIGFLLWDRFHHRKDK